MSYTEIYKFNKKGNAKRFATVQNAFLGALKIWDILDFKYLPPFEPEYMKFIPNSEGHRYHRTHEIKGDGMKQIWGLAQSINVSKDDKICLLSTFDNVIVNRNDLDELIQAFRNFDIGTSLPEQASLIEQEIQNDSSFIAIAWNQTSVNHGAWISDKNGKPTPYNLFDLDHHWDLFKELNK